MMRCGTLIKWEGDVAMYIGTHADTGYAELLLGNGRRITTRKRAAHLRQETNPELITIFNTYINRRLLELEVVEERYQAFVKALSNIRDDMEDYY